MEHSSMIKRCGLLLIDKPTGITSHFVVSAIRRATLIDKVGHLGTLDPFASGLLPVLIGGATRFSDEIMDGKKGYLFTIQLGFETDTLDLSGRVVQEAPVPENFVKLFAQIIPKFIGHIDQIPPAYSALKMNGRPLYEYMRATGSLPQGIETKKRTIFIESIEIVSSEFDKKQITLRVKCGRGTYVRSLARDLSKTIYTVGHCCELRREYVEPWHVDTAFVFAKGKKMNIKEIESYIQDPEQILPNVKKLKLAPQFSRMLESGNIISIYEANQLESCIDINLMTDGLYFVENYESNCMFLSNISIIENGLKIMPKKKII